MNETVNDQPDASENYLKLIVGCQSDLYAYARALMGNASHVHDVLQEANLVLWRKRGEYDRARPFLPWARKIVHFQMLAFRKKISRSHLTFDDEVLSHVAQAFEKQGDSQDQLEALDHCIEQLPPQHRELVERRYKQGESVNAIAHATGRSANSLSAMLYRLRDALARCIEARLAGGEQP